MRQWSVLWSGFCLCLITVGVLIGVSGSSKAGHTLPSKEEAKGSLSSESEEEKTLPWTAVRAFVDPEKKIQIHNFSQHIPEEENASFQSGPIKSVN